MKQKIKRFISERALSFQSLELFSVKETIVICSISLIIVLCRRILSIPLLQKWELTVRQDTTLFSLFVFWEVITVCVLALIPVMLILCIILWYLLKKNTQKLKEINQQRGKITCHHHAPYKKGDRGGMYDNLIAIFFLALVLAAIFFAFIPTLVLEIYYGVFKQEKIYYQLRKKLKRLLEEHNTVLEKL